MKQNAYIAGVAMTRFGKYLERSLKSLAHEAISGALKDANINPNLEIGGIIMTMYDVRTNLSKQVVIEVSTHFEKEVFNTVIPRSVRLSEAPSFGQSILHYDPHSAGSLAYRDLAKEVIQRFNLS